jgi:hypothetical protein
MFERSLECAPVGACFADIERAMRKIVAARALAAGATRDQADHFADAVLDGIAHVQLPAIEVLDASDLQFATAHSAAN